MLWTAGRVPPQRSGPAPTHTQADGVKGVCCQKPRGERNGGMCWRLRLVSGLFKTYISLQYGIVYLRMYPPSSLAKPVQ